MSLVYGAILITVAGLLAASAGVIYQGSRSTVLRYLIGSQAFSVALATLIGLGMVTLLAFLMGFETQSAVSMQAIVAIAVVVAGFGGIRFIAKRTPPH